MSQLPLVHYVVSLTVTQSGEALAGEGVVYVGAERMGVLNLDREHLEVPAAIALQHALDACRDWLAIHSATKELREAPPSSPPAQPADGQTAKMVRVSGTPKSRRRIVSRRLPT